MASNDSITATKTRDLVSWRRLADADRITPARFFGIVALFTLGIIAFQLASWLMNATDYVGIDPDDAMRLVEVRDYLGGQNWFDLMQYRLGPEGGTLMHWSRLIDWPIAALISFFRLFLAPQAAEAAALATWPLALTFPLLASTALASYRMGGKGAMVIGLLLSVVFVAAIVRFRPGAIDHHNVQLVLAMFIAAMLIDPLARASNFAAAAVAGALALAIGAETTPLVAVAAACVAGLWAFDGERYRNAVIGFGVSFTVVTAIIFVGTTPVRLMPSVTCDTLSIGYLSLAAIGGIALAGSALFLTARNIAVRFAALGLIGVAVLAAAMLISPQCLQSPLNGLDPLLKTMWISSIKEAQSIVAEMTMSPESIGGFYAVGLIAIAVSALRISRRQQVIPHAVLLALIAVSWLVTAIQIRGMIFANVLAFIPLSVLIADLRALYVSRQKDMRAAAAFAMSALLSVPSVWTIGGMLAFDASKAIAGVPTTIEDTASEPCISAKTMHDFAKMPPGRILSSFNPGAALLRFTPHSVLTANYHRNQTGMVAALKMAMARPLDALEMLQAQQIRYVLICKGDPLVETMVEKYPDGLFARLVADDVPGYLEEIPGSESGPKIYQVIQR